MQFEISNQILLNADWREVLPMLPDASVDLLLTDPPYGTTAIKWDKKVDWKLFWAEARRVCKENAVMVLFASGKFVPELIASNPKDYRYELVWEKSLAVGHLDANRRPLRAHEIILVFTQKGFRNSTYNPQKTAGVPHKVGGKASKTVHYGKTSGRASAEVVTNLYYPRSVLKYCNKVRGKSLQPDRQTPRTRRVASPQLQQSRRHRPRPVFRQRNDNRSNLAHRPKGNRLRHQSRVFRDRKTAAYRNRGGRPMSYKFTLHDGENIVLPCTYRTRNPDGTRTPIDLRGKRLVLQFVPRSASPILVLDSNASPNANGSGIAITNDVSGRYTVTITAADIATMPVGMWGRSVLNLSTVQRPLWDLPFSKR